MISVGRVLRNAVAPLLGLALVAAGCGGSSSSDAQSGTGTLRDPYVVLAGHAYDIPVMRYNGTCGYIVGFDCLTFDSDYVTIKFTVPETGTYTARFTGVNASNDLVVLAYVSASPTSTHMSYIGRLDDNGNGGSEAYSGPMTAGYYYYLFLRMHGGSDTIQARVDRL